jgi:integrase
MSRPPVWPPRLTRKPGTTEARTYFRGRWWTCGKWDARANKPTHEAIAKHMEYVQVWASDPAADPKGEVLLADVLTDWLGSPDAPVHRADRAWVPKIIRRLIEFQRQVTASAFDAAMLARFQAWLCELQDADGELVYNRTSVKRHIVGKLLRAMVWAAREGRYSVSWEQVFAIKAGPGPKPSRVREGNVVLPCERADLDRVIGAAHPQLAAILELLWWTGARPSELLSLRAGDIQRSGELKIPKVTPITLGDVWAAQVKC